MKKPGAITIVLCLAALAGAAGFACEDTGPSPIGNHPEDSGLDTGSEEDAAGDASDEGGDAESDATDEEKDAGSDASDADAADAADGDG